MNQWPEPLTLFTSAFHIDCRILTLISPQRKFSGMCPGCNSNSRSTGSTGLNCCQRQLAALVRFTSFGKLGQGSSVSSSVSTSLTIANARTTTTTTTTTLFFHPKIYKSGLLNLCPLALGDWVAWGPRQVHLTPSQLQQLYRHYPMENIKCNNPIMRPIMARGCII